MKLQNKLFFFGISLTLAFGCVAKKTISSTKTNLQRDSIFITKTIKEIERFTDTLTIEKPCDSLGNLKPFKQLIKVPQGNIVIQGVNDVITAEIDLNGYKDQLEEVYKIKYQKFTENYNKETVIYRTPFYHWLIHILCVLIIYLLIRF